MTKSLIRKRREQGAICSNCQSPDYTITPSQVYKGGKPNIKCNSCDNSWQYGYDSGIYAELKNENDRIY